MVAKLTVLMFALVCLLIGVLLVLMPWVNIGYGDWGDNYLLALAVEKTGLPVIHETVTSPWIRGAISGLGVFNIFVAFWEIINFKKSVAMLEGGD
ncbi:MAG: hypothetical protein ACK5NT_09040 [Pyrinomonadaceae bacterium]